MTELDTLYTIVSFVNSTVPILFGALFFMLSIPACPELQPYRISRKAMAWAYLIIGLFTIGEIFLMGENSSDDYTLVAKSTLAIASFQAFLFTYVCILLIDTAYVTYKTTIRQLTPIIILSVLVIISTIASNILFDKIIIILFTTFYIYQLIYYTYLFLSREKVYRIKAKNYFSGDEVSRLQWVKTTFFSALIIGICALFLIIFPYPWFNISFTIASIVFYFFFAVKFLEYPQTFHLLEPVVITPESQTSPEPTLSVPSDLSFNLKLWVDNKEYTTSGITINDLAKTLKTNRTYLSAHINTQNQMNFNAWINSLRIQEAQRLILEQPDEPLSAISEKLGYSEVSNFSRQFKLFTGISPALWKKNNS